MSPFYRRAGSLERGCSLERGRSTVVRALSPEVQGLNGRFSRKRVEDVDCRWAHRVRSKSEPVQSGWGWPRLGPRVPARLRRASSEARRRLADALAWSGLTHRYGPRYRLTRQRPHSLSSPRAFSPQCQSPASSASICSARPQREGGCRSLPRRLPPLTVSTSPPKRRRSPKKRRVPQSLDDGTSPQSWPSSTTGCSNSTKSRSDTSLSLRGTPATIEAVHLLS